MYSGRKENQRAEEKYPPPEARRIGSERRDAPREGRHEWEKTNWTNNRACRAAQEATRERGGGGAQPHTAGGWGLKAA